MNPPSVTTYFGLVYGGSPSIPERRPLQRLESSGVIEMGQRYGYRPSHIAFLAHQAWGDNARGQSPDLISRKDHRRYNLATISTWLALFLRRFVETSQFKRSTLPNGPKVGSGRLRNRMARRTGAQPALRGGDSRTNGPTQLADH